MQQHSQRKADGDTGDPLNDIAGNTGGRRQTLAQDHGGVGKIAQDHDGLPHDAADQHGSLPATQGPEDQRRYQGVKTLNDQGAGGVVAVAAEQIHQHGADTGRRRAIPRPQQPTGEQHEAVAQIHIAVDGGRDLNDAGSHIDKGGHQSTEN